MTFLLVLWLLLDGGAGWCSDMRVTGYVRTDHGSHTFDGTPIWTSEPIAAASWDIPLGWHVTLDDGSTYRVADRGGGLGSSGWVDIAVWTRSEAYALTGVREVCVSPPGARP